MDKIFDAALAVILTLFLVKTIPVMACSGNPNQGITGAACSISELNSKIENNNPVNKRPVRESIQGKSTNQGSMFINDLIEKDLDNIECPIGNCLLKRILK